MELTSVGEVVVSESSLALVDVRVSLFFSLVYRIVKFSLFYRLRVRRTFVGISIRFCAYFVPYPVQFGTMEL